MNLSRHAVGLSELSLGSRTRLPISCDHDIQVLAKEREVEMGKEDLANKPEAIRCVRCVPRR